MEKIIKIDGRDIKFKAAASLPYRYKNQFGTDVLALLMPIIEAALETLKDNQEEFEKVIDADKLSDVLPEVTQLLSGLVGNCYGLELIHVYNLLWVMAKTADDNTPPPMEWLDSFGQFPLKDIVPEVFSLLIPSLFGTVSIKKNPAVTANQ